MNKSSVHFIIVFFLGLIFTIILTWPFARVLPSYYSDGGDYPVNGSINMYNQEALKTGRIFNQQEYFNGYQFYPLPLTLAYNDHAITLSLIFSPIFWLTHNIPLSLNITNLLTFILSFIASFYVINSLVKNFWASVIGAFIYTFNPNTFAHFPYHLNLMSRFFLPLVFLFAYKFFKEPKFKNALLLGVFFTLNALSEAYFFAFTLVILPLLFFPFLIFNLYKKEFYYFVNLIKSGSVWIIFLPLLLYFTLPYLDFTQKEGVIRSLDQNIVFSARIIDWLSPPKESLLYGAITQSIERSRDPVLFRGDSLYYEQTLFLNLLPSSLFLLAGIIFLKRTSGLKNTTSSRILNFSLNFNKGWKFIRKLPYLYFWWLLIISSTLTFGPYFLGWNGNDGQIKLPFYYLYEYLPFLKGVRVPSRFQFIFYIPFSIFVSFGALYLLNRFKNIKYALVILMMILLIVENFHLRNFDDSSKIYQLFTDRKLAADLLFLKGKPVLHLPINLPNYGKESAYLNWAVNTGEILVNGNSSYLPPDHAALLLSFKENMGDMNLNKLDAIGVDYIVIHKDLIERNFWTSYPQLHNLLQAAVVLENNDFKILDLSKTKLLYKKCDFDKDIQISFTQANYVGYSGIVEVATVKNNQDCYFPSIFEDRYRKATFYINFIKHTAYLKLPPVIGPYEQVSLDSLSKTLRIK